MPTTFRSRAVSEDGYYEIDFTTFGISLTKITRDEWLLLPKNRGVHLLTNQYIEGSDFSNYVKRMDVGGLQPPTGLVSPFGITYISDPYLKDDEWFLTNGSNVVYNGESPKFVTLEHKCEFVPYVGLIESFNHCESCGKKQ